MEVKIDTTFIDRMGPMTEAIKRAVQRGIEDGARLMESGAKKRVQRGSKTGETYEKYNPRRTHTASAPGESPATDTGYLASNTARY